jgi:flagellar protein FlgJ
MLVNKPLAPGNDGPNGLQMAQSAEKLESVLWQQVLSSMTKTATGGSNLGVGSGAYNEIATHALSTSLFGHVDASLTQEIVGQLKGVDHHVPARSHLLPMTSLGASLSSMIALHHDQGLTGAVNAATSATPLSPSALAQYEKLPVVQRAIAYTKEVWPLIKQSATELNVPPVAILAQSALETGWGIAAPGNNLFGIKALPGQAATNDATKEQINGVMVPMMANFAAYSSIGDSVAHYTDLIKRAYQSALGSTSVEQYGSALLRGGYMTDTGYVQKLVSVSQSPIMQTVLAAVGATE